jgi:hypothetical protein
MITLKNYMKNASQSTCKFLIVPLVSILCLCQCQVSNSNADIGSDVEMQLLGHSGMEESAIRDLGRHEVARWLVLSADIETLDCKLNPDEIPSCVLRPVEYYSFRMKKHGRWTPCAPFSARGGLLFPNTIRSARKKEEMRMFLTSVIMAPRVGNSLAQ